jgi:glycosyltransferase involved in cell wall biosynthesis
LSLVTPSEWLADKVRRSGLLGRFPVQCIPNGIDTNIFRPRDQRAEKTALGLDAGSPVILFVSAMMGNPWKGLPHLAAALPLIKSKYPRVQFLAVGKTDSVDAWPLPVITRSTHDENEIARLYAAADVLVIPSVAENSPNVIVEAQACGVPAAGFRVGGVPESIREGETGMLAPDQNAAALAETTCRLLEAVLRERGPWQERCRARALREHALGVQAGRYSAVYRSMLESEAAGRSGASS